MVTAHLHHRDSVAARHQLMRLPPSSLSQSLQAGCRAVWRSSVHHVPAARELQATHAQLNGASLCSTSTCSQPLALPFPASSSCSAAAPAPGRTALLTPHTTAASEASGQSTIQTAHDVAQQQPETPASNPGSTAACDAAEVQQLFAQPEVHQQVSEWEDKLHQIEGIAAEMGTAFRRARIRALRLEMDQIVSHLPTPVAQHLRARLQAEREQRTQARTARLQAALTGSAVPGGMQGHASGQSQQQVAPCVVIDCGFAVQHCRPGLEVRSLAKQVEWSMAFNRRSSSPVSLQVTGWTGEVKAAGEAINSQGWPVVFHEGSTLDTFSNREVVVLSPDAVEPLLNIEPGTVYVVGGIVDRTVIKGATVGFAESHGLRSMRLPIAEHAHALGMAAPDGSGGINLSPVLNVSDVVIALIVANATGGDWVTALDLVIPQRKRRKQVPRVRKPRVAKLAGAFGKAAEVEQDRKESSVGREGGSSSSGSSSGSNSSAVVHHS